MNYISLNICYIIKLMGGIMKENFCESCGMPLINKEEIATNKDGSLNDEYCIYCYKDGEYTVDCTMDEMIEISLEHLDEMNKESGTEYTKEEARALMNSFFPKLKRWQECTCTDECGTGCNPKCTCNHPECHCRDN